MSLDELIHRILDLSASPKPHIVAISGFGGSGKSTLARQLAAALGNTEIVSIDEFWIPDRDRLSEDWTVFDRDRLLQQVLIPASRAEPIRYQPFDWNQGQLGDWRSLNASGYLIIEGISTLHPNLLPYYQFKIWIDCSLELAQTRGLNRGKTEYNIDETEAWINRWTPNDRAYFNKYRPDLTADFIYAAD